MYFKVKYTINNISASIEKLIKHEFNYKLNERQVKIIFKQIENELLGKKYNKGDFFCEATTEFDIEINEEDLSQNKTERENSANYRIIRELESDLNSCIKNIIFNIHWVLGLSDIKDLIKFGDSISWSKDNITWKHFPFSINLNISVSFPYKKEVSEEDIVILKDLIKNDFSAPLGHSLFAEAWTLRTSNPRSSLVIGIAAVETRFKECVTFLMPTADWLIQNVPSPPLVKMLTQFLLNLPVRGKIYGKIIAPPKILMTHLQNGIELRNKLVHGSRNEFTKKDLEQILKACRDIIYLLDFYCGHSWATSNLSHRTIEFLTEKGQLNENKQTKRKK